MSAAGAGFDGDDVLEESLVDDFVGALVDDGAMGFNAFAGEAVGFVARCGFVALDDFVGAAIAVAAAFALPARTRSVTWTVCLPADWPAALPADWPTDLPADVPAEVPAEVLAARAPGARMVLLDIGPLLDQLPR
jgi:hypothetical protein